MKTRRIWIVIAVILIAGICSTTYTKRYVAMREIETPARIMTEAAKADDEAAAAPAAGEPAVASAKAAAGLPSTAAAVPVPGAADAADAAPAGAGAYKMAAEDGAAAGEAGEVQAAPVAANQQEAAADEASAAFSTGVQAHQNAGAAQADETLPAAAETEAGQIPSPQNPSDASYQGNAPAGAAPTPESQSEVIVAGGTVEKAAVSYKKRLEDLDAQIKRNREADAEKSISNSIKARAENELKLWEAELDGIMKALEEHLGPEQVEKLYTEQREWRREKESKAWEAARKQSGSTLEEVEYTVSLAESTRARAYELVKEYEAVLE